MISDVESDVSGYDRAPSGSLGADDDKVYYSIKNYDNKMSGRRHWPRHGSMQFWPRVKAKRAYARIRTWTVQAKEPVLGFVGYKAGMTHVMGIDTRKNAATKGDEIFVPVTVIECPPMKIAGVRFYTRKYTKVQPFKDVLFKFDKHLSRKVVLPKKAHDLAE